MAAVTISAIEKSFGSTAVLKRVSLDIADGEFVTLVGPSGCGKSTLLRIIAGLDYADEGSIAIDRQPVDALAPKRRDVAMVFQSYALYPYMTVAENIALPLIMRRLSMAQRLPVLGRLLPGTSAAKAAIAADVAAAARSLDIEHLLPRKPSQLSGGQRQRVALGRAMVRHPKVFLMDEPLSNLDAKLRVQMRAEIAELHRRLRSTFIYVTHDQAEAMTMSDRVAVMMHGELHQVAPPQQIYHDPASLAVAEFIGSPKINLLPAQLRADGRVEALGQAVPLAIAGQPGPVTLGLRPETLELTAGNAGWVGRITHREDLGSELFLHVALEDGNHRLVLRGDPAQPATLAIGSRVALRPRIGLGYVFDAAGHRLQAMKKQPQPVAAEALRA